MTTRGRNPRRAYDKDGREIAPMTLADMRDLGGRSVLAWSEDCQHHAIIGCDSLPADLPVPDVAMKLRCTACGSKRITVQINMTEMQAEHRRQFPPRGSGALLKPPAADPGCFRPCER